MSGNFSRNRGSKSFSKTFFMLAAAANVRLVSTLVAFGEQPDSKMITKIRDSKNHFFMCPPILTQVPFE